MLPVHFDNLVVIIVGRVLTPVAYLCSRLSLSELPDLLLSKGLGNDVAVHPCSLRSGTVKLVAIDASKVRPSSIGSLDHDILRETRLIKSSSW